MLERGVHPFMVFLMLERGVHPFMDLARNSLDHLFNVGWIFERPKRYCLARELGAGMSC
jgi:hypothetical protein